jgi:hypothetical protein
MDMGCSDISAPPRRLHLSLPEPIDDLTRLGDVTPVELHISADHEAGLVVMRVVEPGRPELELVLGAAAGLDAALRIAAAVARLKELWRDP